MGILNMNQCEGCHGFIPVQVSMCPNCQRKEKTSKPYFKRAIQLVLGASVTMTLAACYGTPPPMPVDPCDDDSKGETKQKCEPSASPSPSVDASASEPPKTTDSN